MQGQAVGDRGQILTLALHVRRAERHLERLVGDLALDQPVGALVLEEQDRVRILDGRPEHARRVVGRPWDDHLEAGDVAVGGLDRLRVVQGPVHAASPGRTDDHRQTEVPVAPIPHPRDLRDHLVVGGVDEVGELDLGDRQEPVQGHAHRDPDDAGFGQRRIDHALVSELGEEILRHAEDPAARRDVLAEHHDALVRGHLVVQGVVDRRDDVLLGHSPSRSKNTCRSRVDGSGSAAFQA